jgi:hypothetical protein
MRLARTHHDDVIAVGIEFALHTPKRLPQPPLPPIAKHGVADPPRHREPQPRPTARFAPGGGVEDKRPAGHRTPNRIHPGKLRRAEQA